MSADTTSRPTTSFSDSNRDFRNRLGNPDGNDSQNGETWQDFLRQRVSFEQAASNAALQSSYNDILSRRPPRRPRVGSAAQHLATAAGSTSSPASNDLSSSAEEVALPQWQPDSEVTACPICANEFSFWFRKHHCRKCGRVICANCSPHRIIIPRQYIVQPPNSENAIDLEAIQALALGSDQRDRGNSAQRRQSLSQNGSTELTLQLGGGEEVRICNPCVPDPNTSPPPHQEQSTSRPHRRAVSYGGNMPNNRPVTPGGFVQRPDATARGYPRPRRQMSRQQELEQFYALGQPMLDPMHTYDDLVRRRHNGEASGDAAQHSLPSPGALAGRRRGYSSICEVIFGCRPTWLLCKMACWLCGIRTSLLSSGRCRNCHAWNMSYLNYHLRVFRDVDPRRLGDMMERYQETLKYGGELSWYEESCLRCLSGLCTSCDEENAIEVMRAERDRRMANRFSQAPSTTRPMSSRPAAASPANAGPVIHNHFIPYPVYPIQPLPPYPAQNPAQPPGPPANSGQQDFGWQDPADFAQAFEIGNNLTPWETNNAFPRRPPPPSSSAALPDSEICPCCHKSYASLRIGSGQMAREQHVRECLKAITTTPAAGAQGPQARPRHGQAEQLTHYYILEQQEIKNMKENGSLECVICMDDFEVGQEMGRLECLCRFHKACIKDWFNAQNQTNRTRCPIHLHW